MPQTIWLTGLPAAGKTTIANSLLAHLKSEARSCCVLDGDVVRHGLNRDLGFSVDDRKENIRRIAEVAKILNDVNVLVIAAFIAPLRTYREMAREIVGDNRFIEVHVSTSVEVCERRDPKGLYAKARAGLISDFTGVSSVYEPPRSAALVLDTEKLSLEQCVELLLRKIS